MNELGAVSPGPGIAAMMKAPQHHDVVALDNEEQGVGKSTKDSLSHLTVDGGERSREPNHSLRRSPNPESEIDPFCAGSAYADRALAGVFLSRYGRMLASSDFPSRWAKNRSHRS